MTEFEQMDQESETSHTADARILKKKPKRGIIYLSTIPPHMNVLKIREVFGEFGKVGRVYLQLAEAEANGEKKLSKKRIATKFTEGWVEYEKKSVAKRVAQLLNNTQVSTKKSSKHYDIMWNIKYLSNFKWPHLHERLAYEKAARRQKLRAEIQLAKKQTNFFTQNLVKMKKNRNLINKEYQTKEKFVTKAQEEEKEDGDERKGFLQSLFK